MRRTGCGSRCGTVVIGSAILLLLWTAWPAFRSFVILLVGLAVFGLAMLQVATGLGDRRGGHQRRSTLLRFDRGGRRGRRREDHTR